VAFVRVTAAWEPIDQGWFDRWATDPGLPPHRRGKAEVPPSWSNQAIAIGTRQNAPTLGNRTSGRPPDLAFGAIAPTSDRVLLSCSAHGHLVRLLPEISENPAATMLRWLQLVNRTMHPFRCHRE
jgi:hypothetical protein